MSCRETAIGSALTSWARFSTGHVLSERATLSTFHHLQSVYRARSEDERRAYSEQRYRNLIAEERRNIQNSTVLTEAERASLLARMDRADTQPTPNQATIYALMHIRSAVQDRRIHLQSFLSHIAEENGISMDTARAEFNRIAAAVPGRTAVSADDAVRAAQYGLARDAGTVAAMNHMLSATREYQAAVAHVAPQRIENMTVVESEIERVTGVPGIRVHGWGYDPRNGRLEVVLENADGSVSRRAYRNVTPTVIAAMHDDAGFAWAEYVRGNPNFQYADENEATIDGAAPRCGACGQFANNEHTCPARATEGQAPPTPPAAAAAPVAVERRSITDSTALIEEGYDPATGRLELVMRSNPSHVYAYTVPPEVYQEFISAGSLGSYYARNIRNNPAYRVGSATAVPTQVPAPVPAETEAVVEETPVEPVVPVPTVTEFRRGTAGMRWTQQAVGESSVWLPSAARLREAATNGGARISFTTLVPLSRSGTGNTAAPAALVQGSLTIAQEPGSEPALRESALLCNCDAYRASRACPHTLIVINAAMERIAGRNNSTTPTVETEEETVQEAAEDVIAVADNPVELRRWNTRCSQQTVEGYPSIAITLPLVRRLQELARSQGANIEVNQWFRVPSETGGTIAGRVSGTILATQNGETGSAGPVLLDSRQLRCNCQAWRDNGHCEHIDVVRAAVRQRISGQRRRPVPRDPNAPQTVTVFSPRDFGQRWTRQSVTQYVADSPTAARAHGVQVMLPGIRNLTSAARNGGARVENYAEYVNAAYEGDDEAPTTNRYGYRYNNQGRVMGNFTVTQENAREEAVVDVTELRCTCQQWRDTGHCVHIDLVGQAVRDRIERADRLSPEAQEERAQAGREAAIHHAATRLQREADAAQASDWMRDETTAAEARRTWRESAEVLYSEDRAAFIEDIRTAQEAAQRKGAPDIPYMRENALDGLCQRGSGKAFGVEIEYQFPDTMSYPEREAAQRRIGQQLYAAGLTYSPEQQGYRASQRRGFRDVHSQPNGEGNWSWEHDGSVDGELVTPGMYDEPETWQKLELAISILRDNGAVAGTKAGAHVHVGTADFQGSAAAYTELSRLVTQHEDAIARLASDPKRGEHRNNGYSKPLPPVPPTGFSSVTEARTWQNSSAGRYAVMNLANVSGGDGDHPEFRIFDSTLDPGAIQAQIKLAVTMTDAARRNAESGGTSRGKEPWGAHVRRGTTTSGIQSPEDIAAEGSTICSLLDMLYRRRSDKAQAAAVIANTRWTKPVVNH